MPINVASRGIKHVFEMISSGANLIDVGGESTRPGSKGVNANIEWKRISTISIIGNRELGLIKTCNIKLVNYV